MRQPFFAFPVLGRLIFALRLVNNLKLLFILAISVYDAKTIEKLSLFYE